MSLSKIEVQRMMERIGRLENQVASINFKLTAFENILKPEAILRKVREAEAEEKRKADKADVFSSDLLTAPNKSVEEK